MSGMQMVETNLLVFGGMAIQGGENPFNRLVAPAEALLGVDRDAQLAQQGRRVPVRSIPPPCLG